MHRLPPLERGRKPIINEVQPDMHPLEILADIKKLINVQYVRGIVCWSTVADQWPQQQPLTASYVRIIQAIALYDHFIDVQEGQFVESEQLAQHVVQSVVWETFGISISSHDAPP